MERSHVASSKAETESGSETEPKTETEPEPETVPDRLDDSREVS